MNDSWKQLNVYLKIVGSEALYLYASKPETWKFGHCVADQRFQM